MMFVAKKVLIMPSEVYDIDSINCASSADICCGTLSFFGISTVLISMNTISSSYALIKCGIKISFFTSTLILSKLSRDTNS